MFGSDRKLVILDDGMEIEFFSELFAETFWSLCKACIIKSERSLTY